MSSTRPAYVLIKGTVYHLVHRWCDTADLRYARFSIPPGHQPGKAHRTRAHYPSDRLPAHQVITEERALEIQKTTVDAFIAATKARRTTPTTPRSTP